MNEYTIEKFKVAYDDEGNEILKEKVEEIRKKNFISLRVKDKFATRSVDGTHSVSANGEIENYLMGVCTEKAYSKLAAYYNHNSNITDDSTYAGSDKIIIGSRLTGEDLSVVTEGDIVVHTMKCRFNPPSSGTREINSVFLGSLETVSAYAGSIAALSNILLDAPCYQESDEILVITYRFNYNFKETLDSISFKDNNLALAQHTAHMLNLFDSSAANTFVSPPNKVSINSHSYVEVGKDLTYMATSGNEDFLALTDLMVSHINGGEGYFKFTSEIDANTLNGVLINSYTFYGYNNINLDTTIPFYGTLAEVKLRSKTDTCVQNTYVKTKSNVDAYSTAPVPFYDLNHVGSSLGSVNVNESFTSGDSSYEYKPSLIELMRLEVTQGGATGTAKYKVSTKYLTSTKTGNHWETDTSNWIMGDVGEGSGHHSTNDLNRLPEAIGDELSEMINADMVLGLEMGEVLVVNTHVDPNLYGIWVYNFDRSKTEFPVRLDATTVTGFNATDIRGVTTAEDGTIFVACAATGLWKLKRNAGDAAESTSVTRIVNTGAAVDTSCFAVNFCRLNGRFNSDAKLYALFNGELCISADGGQNWSMYNAGTSTPFNFTGDINKVIGICPNYHDSENEVAILMTKTDIPSKFGDGISSVSNYYLQAYFWNESVSLANGVSEHLIKDIPQFRFRNLTRYAAGNGIFKSYFPEASYPNHKWCYKSTTSSTGNLIKLAASLGASEVNLFDGAETINNMVLIDDVSANKTHVIGASASNNLSSLNTQGYFYNTIENVSALVQFAYCLRRTSKHLQSVTYIGRNVLLTAGRCASNGTHPKDSVNFGTTRASLMAFYDPSNTSRDFYEGNPLNLWFNWTYSLNGWEIDGTGDVDRLTHVNNLTLVRGLSVNFADDTGNVGSPVNFVKDEFFDVYLADGVVKDSYTSFTLDGMLFFGASKEGTDFYPTSVPLVPETNATIPLAVEYFNDEFTNELESIAFEVDYIGHSGIDGWGGNIVPLEKNFALMAPRLDSNFTIEFRMATSIAYSVIDVATNSSTHCPQFGLTNNNANVGTTASPFIYGLNLKSGANHNQKMLYVFYEDNYDVITIDDYAPQLDSWKIVRSGQSIELRRNDIPIHTTTITPTSLRVMYNAKSNHYNVPTAYGNPISIFSAKLTFDDYRLTSRIGNPVDATGSWDANFGKMHIEELLLGVKKIFLDGVEASIICDAETSTPNQGTVRVCRGTGELVFSPDDAGKVITGSWRIIPSVNVREV